MYHIGEGDKTFPLGNGSVYLPVQLLNIQGPSAEIGINAVELDGTILSTSPSLTAVSAQRYWQLDVVSGSLNDSRVVLPVRDEDIVTDTNVAVVAQSESLTGNFESLGQFDFQGTAANGMVTSDRAVTKNFLAVATASSEEGVTVYNAISPNDDGPNDHLTIGNIENFPENKFTVFTRWGDKVFEIENYDNQERVFRGKTNIGGEKDLVNGVYFYTLETKKDGKKLNGYLALKR